MDTARGLVAPALVGIMLLGRACNDQPDPSKRSTPSALCVHDYCLSRRAGDPGTQVTVSAPIRGRNKRGRLVPTDRIQVWWDLGVIDVLDKRPDPKEKLLAEESTPAGTAFRFRFSIPKSNTGLHPMVLVVYAGGNPTSVPFQFEVTN